MDLPEWKGPSTPRVSRFEAYESPVGGGTISSDRQRERDLFASDSYDVRDTPKEFVKAKEQRDKANAGYSGEQQLDFWR